MMLLKCKVIVIIFPCPRCDLYYNHVRKISITPRVLPSGKAAASQAAIRGFESHHPLFKFAPP